MLSKTGSRTEDITGKESDIIFSYRNLHSFVIISRMSPDLYLLVFASVFNVCMAVSVSM